MVDSLVALVNALADDGPEEVWLGPGTYAVTSTLTISRNLTLVAAHESVASVLDGQGATRVLAITGGSVLLHGLEVQNGVADFGGGILITGGHINLVSCTIRDNEAIA